MQKSHKFFEVELNLLNLLKIHNKKANKLAKILRFNKNDNFHSKTFSFIIIPS